MAFDIDRSSRDKIEKEIDKNFFVEAGAGSGKTHELVRRMVAMVEGGVDVSKICTITFTKAAANEFYDRFQRALSESKSPLAQKALKNIDLCFMGTIDSFCNMVLSEHPLEARIPSDASVIESDDMDALYQREFSKIQQGEYGEDLKKKCARFREYFSKSESVFVSAISFLMRTRNAHLNYDVPSSQEPDDLFENEKKELISLLTNIKNHPEAEYDEKGSKAAWELLDDCVDTVSDSWNGNLGNVVYALNKIKGLRITKECGDIAGLFGPYFDEYFVEHKGKKQWYEVDPEKSVFGIDKFRNYIYSIAVDFIHECVLLIAEKLRRRGELSFFDYLLYLRDLLKEDAANGGKLIKHIYDRHSYYLIDEFQDTDPLQTEIFFYLTAQKPDPDYKKCIPQPGSLFIVGDPKQSIYRFKNADVSSFLRTKSIFEKSEVGEVLKLTRNFRSSDPMCEWFNKVFKTLLPVDTPIQSKFGEIPTGEKTKYAATLSGAYKYTISFQKRKDDNEDFEKVADIIDGLVDNPVITVQDRGKDGKKCEPRTLSYKDIMVITPGKTNLSYYMNSFTRHGVPFKVEGKTTFNECSALISLTQIFAAAADPYDKKAVFAARTISGCAVSESEIFDLHNKAKNLTPIALYDLILESRQVLLKTGTENLEYIYYAKELLRTAEASGKVTSQKEAAVFLKDMINSPTTERCLQLVSDGNRVHLANLHKVKGLEAPIVILADPSKSSHSALTRVDYEPDEPQCYIFSLKDLKTDKYAAEEKKENEVMASEMVRLQYVAATRAADAIIVGNCVTKKGDSSANMWAEFISFIEDDRDIEEVIKSAPKKALTTAAMAPVSELYKSAEDTCVLNERDSQKKSYEIIRPSMITLKGVTSSEDDYEDKAAEKIKTGSKKENAALIGTMVHKLMEVLVSSACKVNIDEAISEIVRDYEADTKEYRDLLKKVADTILSGGFRQENEVPEDILKELLSADEVYCELPFCYKEDEGKIWNGVMDVVYCKDGNWHIVDYKTNLEASDLDEKYKDQLGSYIKAFKTMTGQDADALIYHIEV